MVKHVILDTDIGFDPDDMFALLLALYSPEISLDLVITSDEHEGHRAAFAQRLIESLGFDIPVVKGSDLGNYNCVVCNLVKEPFIPQINYLSAVSSIVDNNQFTHYVCISPQTNLAAFLRYAPELKSKLELVMMGGAIDYRDPGVAEHNVRLDAESAKRVFDSDVAKRYVLSDTTWWAKEKMEITEQHPLYKQLLEKGSPLLADGLVLYSLRNWFKQQYPHTVMHDPLTLSYVISGAFVLFQEKRLRMNEKGVIAEATDGKPTIVSKHAKDPEQNKLYGPFMNFMSSRMPF